MLAKRGASVLVGPVMQSVPLDDLDATIAATRRITEGDVDVFVLTTGVGTRSWMGVAELAGLDEDLRATASGAYVMAQRPQGAERGDRRRVRGGLAGDQRDGCGDDRAPERARGGRQAGRASNATAASTSRRASAGRSARWAPR